MDNKCSTAGVGAHGSASSPVSARSAGGGGKRKRSGAGFDSSPGSGGEIEDEEADRRRHPGVKRACNECRQQKVSHRQICQWDCATVATKVIDHRRLLIECATSYGATSYKTPLRSVHDATGSSLSVKLSPISSGWESEASMQKWKSRLSDCDGPSREPKRKGSWLKRKKKLSHPSETVSIRTP